jgi:cyanophycinase
MLALIGSGEYLPPMEPVDRYLLNQLPGPARVVCLPTAAGTEGQARLKYWMDLGVEHFTQLGVQVEAVEIATRAHAHEPRLVEPINLANFIYLSGGKPDYLYKTLEGTLAWEAIINVHQRGGVVAGCSAGAMIMGEGIMGMRGVSEGFGLLPGVMIMPHFDEISGWMVRTARLFAGKRFTLVGIDGNTALVQEGETQKVVGIGGVTVFRKDGSQRYAGGEVVELL